MRIVLSLAFVAAVLTACTIDSDKMNNKDALRAYGAPMFCAKQQECARITFTIAYSTRASLDAADPNERERLERVECERRLNDEEAKKETELTGCTNEDYQACRRDFLASTCPSDPSATLPPLPPSCEKC